MHNPGLLQDLAILFGSPSVDLTTAHAPIAEDEAGVKPQVCLLPHRQPCKWFVAASWKRRTRRALVQWRSQDLKPPTWQGKATLGFTGPPGMDRVHVTQGSFLAGAPEQA